jgi:hypothetical protein
MTLKEAEMVIKNLQIELLSELRQFVEARGWQIAGEYLDAGVFEHAGAGRVHKAKEDPENLSNELAGGLVIRVVPSMTAASTCAPQRLRIPVGGIEHVAF